MKKVDAHTAASVLEDELFALLQDIRKARFAMDILLGNMIPEEDITNVSHEELLVNDKFNYACIEIINDYLFTASQKMANLYNLCSKQEATAC